MKIKYNVTYIGEIEIPNNISDDEIAEIINEYIQDTYANDIDWEVINNA